MRKGKACCCHINTRAGALRHIGNLSRLERADLMEMHKFFRMLGGEDNASYAKNSSQQRLIMRKVKSTLEKCIEELLLQQYIHDHFRPVSCIKVADLGCSSGPNTFLTMQNIIESIDKISCKIFINQEFPTIQYFLNDLVSNDFNLVFKRLPQFYEKLEKENGRPYGSYLVAAIPGTFYGKLFPNCSMHFLHSSYSLHWLSQVPRGLTTELGIPIMNKSNIYCAKTSPIIVQQAYQDQFAQDFSIFLKKRSEEMVQDGHALLTFICENSEDIHGSTYLHLMGTVLTELVNQGYIEEKKLDSFNLPIYHPSVDETKQIIEKEGSFQIQTLETFKTPMDAGFESTNNDDPFERAKYVATYLRSVFEPLLVSHFGEAIMDDLFSRFAKKLVNVLQMGQVVTNNIVISLRKIY